MKRSPIRRPGTTTWHWRFLMVTWLAVAVLGAPTRRGRDHATGSSAKQVCFCPLFGNNYDSVRSLLSKNIYLMFMTLYHDIGKSYLCCRNNSENPFTCTPNANQLSWFYRWMFFQSDVQIYELQLFLLSQGYSKLNGSGLATILLGLVGAGILVSILWMMIRYYISHMTWFALNSSACYISCQPRRWPIKEGRQQSRKPTHIIWKWARIKFWFWCR